MSAKFMKGLWGDSKYKTIGDSSWFSEDSNGTGLIVQSGSLCFLISCHSDDIDKKHKIILELADAILKKQ
jgi:hypothetical protein